MEALTQLHRLLLLVPLTKRGLPHVSWPLLWGALFSLGAFVSQSDEFFAQPRVPHVAAKLLQLVNLLLVLGDQIFPTEAVFEAFAYELVRVHENFDRLFVVCKRVAPDLMGSSSMTRSLIVQVAPQPPRPRAPRAAPPHRSVPATGAPAPDVDEGGRSRAAHVKRGARRGAQAAGSACAPHIHQTHHSYLPVLLCGLS